MWGCFVEQRPQNALRARTQTTKKTMNLQEVFDTQILTDKIQVGNIKGNSTRNLPQVFVKDRLPVSMEDVPTQPDIDKWNHLIKLPSLTNNCIPRVTMIIGSNVPAATLPYDNLLQVRWATRMLSRHHYVDWCMD